MDVLENKTSYPKRKTRPRIIGLYLLALYTLTPTKFTGLATSGSDTGTGCLLLLTVHVVVHRVVSLAPKRVKLDKIGKKSNLHFVVPGYKFKILKGKELLTTYTFNTHQAKHLFCKLCGVQSFYIPRSNPDGYGRYLA